MKKDVHLREMLRTIQTHPEAWNIYTRKEEYEPSFRDQYGRFQYYSSGNRDIFTPHCSKLLCENGFSFKYPEGKKFAVCLTHDIDTVNEKFLSKGFSLFNALISRNYNDIKRRVYTVSSRKDPLRNFDDIMNLEESYGARSTFFFLALDKAHSKSHYLTEHLEEEIHSINDRGWEIGLHGGHESALDPDLIIEEKKRLERILGSPVTGYRNHFLRFTVPDTWIYLSRAGFRYDSTLGYADCTGFRNGMCHPFIPFDLTHNQEINIIEIPLVVMDFTLDGYMRLDIPKSWELVRKLIDVTRQYHGVFTLLWHNTYMQGDGRCLYEKILNYCRECEAWMTSGDQISRFFAPDW